MPYVDIAAAFATTFLGAFLAFFLENLRERRRITDWVRQHVAHLRDGMTSESEAGSQIDALLARQLDACDVWLDARVEADVSEEQWDLLGSVISANAPDFGALLRSEAVTAIPADLALALAQTEYAAHGLEAAAGSVHAALDTVLPLWFDRVVPLSEPDRRRIRRFRESLVALAAAVTASRRPLAAMVTSINIWLG